MRGSNDSAPQPGDWACRSCSYRNYGKNTQGRMCAAPRPADYIPQPRQLLGALAEVREGDWNCPACAQHNASFRIRCSACGASASEDVLAQRAARLASVVVKEDFWVCLKCKEVNYNSRDVCRACDTPRPKQRVLKRQQAASRRSGESSKGPDVQMERRD
jgi:rubrerythrin